MSDRPSDHLARLGLTLESGPIQFSIGDEVEAVQDLLESFSGNKVVVPKGTRLVVAGPSKNFLFPIAVAKPDDPNWRIAVRTWEIQKVNQA